MDEQERYESGLETRRAVLGAAYVDRSLADADAIQRRLPESPDSVRLGRDLGSAWPAPADAQPDYPGHAGRAQPWRRIASAYPGRVAQRRDRRGNPGSFPAMRDLLWRASGAIRHSIWPRTYWRPTPQNSNESVESVGAGRPSPPAPPLKGRGAIGSQSPHRSPDPSPHRGGWPKAGRGLRITISQTEMV